MGGLWFATRGESGLYALTIQILALLAKDDGCYVPNATNVDCGSLLMPMCWRAGPVLASRMSLNGRGDVAGCFAGSRKSELGWVGPLA
jgi:hypothetical protein